MELQELLDNARRNEALLKRLQAFELKLLSCQGWADLLSVLLHDLPREFRIDAVSLKLIDSDGRLRTSVMQALGVEQAALLSSIEFLQHLPEKTLELGAIKPPAPWVSGLSLPLIRNGQCLGVLYLFSERPQRFDPNLATDFIQHLAAVMAACLVLVRHSEEQLHLALTDPLTKADNRRGFELAFQREWARAKRSAQTLALFILDLDHFKQINDQYGHGLGDTVLQQFTISLQKLLRPSDHIGRLGGEEFALLLSDFNAQQIDEVAERIRRLIHQVLVRDDQGKQVKITASAGYMVIAPAEHPNASLADLLAQLDECLYLAKQQGRDRFINALKVDQAEKLG